MAELAQSTPEATVVALIFPDQAKPALSGRGGQHARMARAPRRLGRTPGGQSAAKHSARGVFLHWLRPQ
jgi:hypothetical protein